MNGRGRAKTATPKRPCAEANPAPNAGEDARDAALLKEAVASPGSATVPPYEPEATPRPSIPVFDMDPDEALGESLAQDPRLLTARVGRPSQDTWFQLHPARAQRVRLLAHKPKADASSEFYYVVPELQQALSRNLKAVNVHLVTPLGAGGEALLWTVLESPFSPYHTAVNRILAQGEDFIAKHKFRILAPGGRDKVCDIRYTPITAEDPAPAVPSRPTGELLYEALAAEQRVIAGTDHAIYHALTAGRAL
jgi:hypothetical protein